MDKMTKNFKSIQSVERDGDYILIHYRTRMGNVAAEDGSYSEPSERLGWLIRKAREAGKIRDAKEAK